MNLEEVLKQVNEIEKIDHNNLEVDENYESEEGYICGSCMTINGKSISTKTITDLSFPFTLIIRSLIERIKDAESLIDYKSNYNEIKKYVDKWIYKDIAKDKTLEPSPGIQAYNHWEKYL